MQDVPLEALIALRLRLARLFHFVSHFVLDLGFLHLRIRHYWAPPNLCRIWEITRLNTKSVTRKKNPNAKTANKTTEVVACTSLREGVTTLRVSARTSLRKLVNFCQVPTMYPEMFWTAPGSCRLICAGRSSPFAVIAFAILPILYSRRRAGKAYWHSRSFGAIWG